MVKRNYPKLINLIESSQSVIVLGPRGCGKTYFLGQIVKNVQNTITIDLLSTIDFERFLRIPGLLEKEVNAKLTAKNTAKLAGRLSDKPLLVFLDEVQRIPSLLNEVHRLIELHKPRLFFILTGSSARKLKSENANLLAGRAIRQNFFPLGFDEIEFEPNFSHAMQFGTLPQVFTEPNDTIKQHFLKTYVGTYLQEEIQREAQLKNLEGFSRFLELAALENGNTVNFSKLSRAVGVADTTVKEYYQLLVDTLVAAEIPAWTQSIRGQVLKASKYYLFDNGVINALTGELANEARPGNYRFGRLFENLVITQLIQVLDKVDSPLKLFHYREYAGREVDLILQKNAYAPYLAVEIKSQDRPMASDVKSLRGFLQQASESQASKSHGPAAQGFVICRTPRSYLDEGILFVSITEGLQRIVDFGSAVPNT